MNEEAFNDSFNLFASQGYNGSLEDYKELMIDNNEAFKDSYNLFKSEGYNGSENEFAELIGVDSTIMLTDDELGNTTILITITIKIVRYGIQIGRTFIGLAID